jgi:ribose transport system substrate-binding protein
MHKRLALMICGLLTMFFLGADAPKYRIAVIPKGTTHVFWKSVEAGARKAGEELNVEIIWKGPLKEDDRAEEIKVVEQFVSEGVSGICLAPLDYEALVRPVASAKAANIPVVIYDSALHAEPGKDFVSYVATDNKKGGRLAGEQLVKLLGGKGKVVLLRYAVGSASTMAREDGFMEVMSANPGIEVISKNRYAGPTVATAKDQSMQMMDQLKQADGVFCPNESSTMGMLGALRDSQLTGKIKFVGFDATPALIDALKAGDIQALVAQNPTRMGYLAVKTCVQHLNGEKVEPTIDTGVKLVTLDLLSDPEMRKFLNLQ